MSTGISRLGTFTRVTTFGFGWSVFSSDITVVKKFKGIKQLEVTCGGTLKAIWDTATDCKGYNLYVRANNSDIFSEEYKLARFREDFSEVKFRTLANGQTLLNSMDMVFVGIRCVFENEDPCILEEDDNSCVLCVRPMAIGTEVFINDTQISLLL